ncbi:MAG: SUMF1/EgtB/PvdO family nonheme iron enzyme [Planctomycetota bacterium]
MSLTQRFLSAEELAECHRGLVAVSHCRQLIDRLLQDAESDLRHANVLVLVRWAEIDDGYRRIDELRTECARLSRGEVIVSSEIEATDSDLKYRYASMHLPEPRHPERTVVLEMEVEQPAVEVYLFRYDVVDGTAPEQPPRLIPTPLDAPEPVRWATMSAVAIDAMAPDATLLRTGDLIVQVKSLPTPNTFGDVLDQLGITVIRDALEVPLSVPCATLVATRGWVTGYPLITGPGNRCVVTKRDGHCSARVDNMVPGRYLVLLRQRNYLDLRIPLLIASNNETVHIPMATTRMVPCDNLPDQFVWVPAGDVELGGDLQAYGTETRRPKHVDGFFIARHEVTVGEYVLFLNDPTTMALALASVEQVKHVVRDASPCTPMPEGVRIVDLPRSPGMPVGTRQLSFAAGRFHANCDPTLPIMGVSFLDAKDYCDWLGRQSHNERWHFDLPTAIQWECAARGKDGRFFPWGDSFDPRACLGSRTAPRVDSPAPVGSTVLDESPYGVQDLAGNVREWNRPEPEDNRQWALLRGGCWRDNDRTKFHSAARDSKTLDEVDDRCGFRVVATLK